MYALHRSSRLRSILIVAVPVLLGILELAHPIMDPGAEIYETIAPVARWWTVLHLIAFPLLALFGGCVVLLTINAHGIAVTVARWAMLVFSIAYPAYDAAVGIASGVIVMGGGKLTAVAQSQLETAFQALFFGPVTGSIHAVAVVAWLVGAVATAVVVRRQGAHWSAPALLIVSAVALARGHAPPYGPVAFFSFAIGAALVQLTARHRVFVRVRRGSITIRRG